MKKLMVMLLFLPIFSAAQVVDEYATGEYYHLMRRHDSVFECMVSKPVYVANRAIHVFAGAHNCGYIDVDHVAHIEGSNGAGEQGINSSATGVSGFKTVQTDSAGNPIHFLDVEYGQTNHGVNNSYWWAAGLSSDDGSVYVWGAISGGMCGNGTACAARCQAPVKVPLPNGVRAVQICVGFFLLILDQEGNVYTVGGGGTINNYALGQGNSPNYYDPVRLNLPAPARLICGATYWSYAVLRDNRMYMWCSQNQLLYATLPQGSSAQSTPRDITGNLPFSVDRITEMKTNNESTYCIVDGVLYGWGSRAMGTLGDGTEIDFSRYGGYPTPYGTTHPLYYAYDQGYNETSAGVDVVIQISPINLTPGKSNWRHIWTNPCGYCYQTFASDAFGQLFFAGRDKSVVPDGLGPWSAISGPMQSRYPNSWDKKYWMQVFVASTDAVVYGSPSPDCLPSGAQLWPEACNLYPPSTQHTAPAASLLLTSFQMGDKWVVKADASGTTGADVVQHHILRGTADGIPLDLGVADRPIDTIASAGGVPLRPGSVVAISVTAINNYFDSTTVNQTITISGSAPPIIVPTPDARVKSWIVVQVNGIGRIQVTYWDGTTALLP